MKTPITEMFVDLFLSLARFFYTLLVLDNMLFFENTRGSIRLRCDSIIST